MSYDGEWDIEKYRDEHESDEQWDLRQAFMERWKEDYPEERLVCLARVFTNIEFMGCRYPREIMMEVSRLSNEVAKSYRASKKLKIQRTFVSASDAAEDRAKGVKRQGGVVVEAPPEKSSRISFIAQGQAVDETAEVVVLESDDDDKVEEKVEEKLENSSNPMIDFAIKKSILLEDMNSLACLDVREFQDSMFDSCFGRMVLLMRPWCTKLGNIQASCSVCNVKCMHVFEKDCYSLYIGDVLVARATGATRADAKSMVELLAWNRLRQECVSIVVKEQFIAQGARITTNDVTGKTNDSDQFGTPVENNLAVKMMKMMGWAGGGLGAEAQGISEPIQPNLQMVNRAGLGSTSADMGQLRRMASNLMSRYRNSDCLDVDLVFTSEFSKEERSVLHKAANKLGLQSKSYGRDEDRFLVIRKKLDPFFLFKAVIEKGGSTPKYQVFIPESLRHGRR